MLLLYCCYYYYYKCCQYIKCCVPHEGHSPCVFWFIPAISLGCVVVFYSAVMAGRTAHTHSSWQRTMRGQKRFDEFNFSFPFGDFEQVRGSCNVCHAGALHTTRVAGGVAKLRARRAAGRGRPLSGSAKYNTQPRHRWDSSLQFSLSAFEHSCSLTTFNHGLPHNVLHQPGVNLSAAWCTQHASWLAHY